MKKALRILGLIILVIIFAGTFYFLYQKSQDKPIPYETTHAHIDNIIKKTVATGAVVPRKEIEIKPQVSGIVDEVYVEPGIEIKKGDLVARVKIIPNMINLNNAESRLKRSKISLDNAKRVFTRQQDLFDKGVIPQSDFERYEMDFNNAKEELLAAENNLQLIREGTTTETGKVTNTLIRSTINGMVLDVPIEVGHSVIESNTFNNGTTIATIADMGEMIFEGKVDETEVGKIHEGMALILTIGAIEEKTFAAQLEHIAPKGVEENGAIQFEIRAAVDLREDAFIRAGYSANAAIVLDRADSVLVIEESLVQFINDTAYIEIEIEDQKFEKRAIELGLSDGLKVEIKSGLDKEEKIKITNTTI